MNGTTDWSAIPEILSVQMREKVTAGFANDVDEVKRNAAAIHEATATGVNSAFF